MPCPLKRVSRRIDKVAAAFALRKRVPVYRIRSDVELRDDIEGCQFVCEAKLEQPISIDRFARGHRRPGERHAPPCTPSCERVRHAAAAMSETNARAPQLIARDHRSIRGDARGI